MAADLKKVFSLFEARGTFTNGTPFGSGHIHDTYHIITSDNGCDNYILQRLNNHIFRDIPKLQENIERVTGHLRRKLSSIPGSDVKRECLTLIKAKGSKETWVTDEEGSYWRLYIFISDHRSYDLVDSTLKAYEGGKAIGRFQAMLSDLGGDPLNETIPHFHNIERRLDTLHQVVEINPVQRVELARKEIDEIHKREDEMKIILRLGKEGTIPVRITHNDTKFNNILLDLDDKALCVIDLDTVMPGYVHYDFGDAIRTAANTATEDEQDLSKVSMNIRLFEAYAEGYLSETRSILNETEKEYLAFAPLLLTYTIGTRFLTDFIDGDNYFKVKHTLHNLQRARTQLALLKSMEQQLPLMKEIILKLSK